MKNITYNQSFYDYFFVASDRIARLLLKIYKIEIYFTYDISKLEIKLSMMHEKSFIGDNKYKNVICYIKDRDFFSKTYSELIDFCLVNFMKENPNYKIYKNNGQNIDFNI